MRSFKLFYVAVLLFLSATANAAVECGESVIGIILHSNGTVYFRTNGTCNQWCQLTWSNADQLNRGYAMMLSAQAQSKPLFFYWPNISSCGTQNAVYASPDFITSP